MDPMKMAAQGAVKKNLGPDPSMQQRVDLLRRLMAMRRDMKRPDPSRIKKGPVAKGQPVPRGGSYPQRGTGVPTRLPRPMKFAGKPGYNFGPPEGM